MAAIQNLEVIVDVDIGSALAKLTELQDELREVATAIEEADAVGTEGIDVRTSVDQLDTELAALAAEAEAFERTQSIDIPVRLDQRQFGALRGLLRDAMGDALAGANFPGGAGGVGGGGGRRGFGSSFLAPGTRGASRMGRISAGMGMLFDDPDRSLSGRILRRLSDAFDSAADRINNFDIRMSDLHNLLASLIPILVVFIGTLPAAITALLTLAGAALAAAAAFAVIGGLGALGAAAGGGGMPAMEDFTQFWEDIRDSFFEAFAPLADRLAPVFHDALDGLEVFFQAIANEGDALMALTDEARAFGRWATEFIPTFLRGLAGLIESMSGVFGDLGDFFNRQIITIIRGFVRATLEALPALRDLSAVIMDALPGLVQVSIGFARVATLAIVLFEAIAFLITGFNQLGGETLGIVIAGMLTLATVVALSSKVVGIFAGTAIASAIGALHSYIVVVVNVTLAKLGLVAATNLAARALAVLITTATLLVGIGLLAWTVSETTKMAGLASSIRDATSAMQDFNRVSGRTSGPGFNPYGGRGGPPSGSRGGGSAPAGGGGGVTVNMERSGDRDTDKSDGNKMSWRLGRMTGGRP